MKIIPAGIFEIGTNYLSGSCLQELGFSLHIRTTGFKNTVKKQIESFFILMESKSKKRDASD